MVPKGKLIEVNGNFKTRDSSLANLWEMSATVWHYIQ